MDATNEVPEIRSQLKLGILFSLLGSLSSHLGSPSFLPFLKTCFRLPNLRFFLYRASPR